MNFAETIRTIAQSTRSLIDVLAHDTDAKRFDLFGRNLGGRLLLNGSPRGLSLVARPVILDRYWEFPFAYAAIPPSARRCLDLSSPNLLSLYLARERTQCKVVVVNPDPQDLADTRNLANHLQLSNLDTCCGDAVAAFSSTEMFDCLWAISVLEHIHGESDDQDALRLMVQHTKPGGRVIITVPVDRSAHDEFRDRDYYGTQAPGADDRYFFQRYYDGPSIDSRLLAAANLKPTTIQWFGESVRGQYDAFVSRWTSGLSSETAKSARLARTKFREYSSWQEMPGKGVCGLVFTKPLE